jgi:hypothetical protein
MLPMNDEHHRVAELIHGLSLRNASTIAEVNSVQSSSEVDIACVTGS